MLYHHFSDLTVSVCVHPPFDNSKLVTHLATGVQHWSCEIDIDAVRVVLLASQLSISQVTSELWDTVYELRYCSRSAKRALSGSSSSNSSTTHSALANRSSSVKPKLLPLCATPADAALAEACSSAVAQGLQVTVAADTTAAAACGSIWRLPGSDLLTEESCADANANASVTAPAYAAHLALLSLAHSLCTSGSNSSSEAGLRLLSVSGIGAPLNLSSSERLAVQAACTLPALSAKIMQQALDPISMCAGKQQCRASIHLHDYLPKFSCSIDNVFILVTYHVQHRCVSISAVLGVSVK